MSKEEILATRYGEMLDMINCISIAEGGAEQKIVRRETDMTKILFEM